MQGSQKTSHERAPGLVVGELMAVGHFTAGGEELFVTNGNHGEWFAFTKDGLLAATIFGGPVGTGKRGWTMPEAEPGKTDLTDVRLPEEHFQGCIVKAHDGKIYAVAGHNHNSIVRVDGLEAMKRLSGAIAVERGDLDTAVAWGIQQAALEQKRNGPKHGTMTYVPNPFAIDGALEDWPAALFLPIHEHYDDARKKTLIDCDAALAYDRDHLYIAAHVNDESPASNSATEIPALFKSGDALDVTLGLDPKANPLRPGPVPGDLRILIARVKGKPVVVVYRYNVPGTPDEKRQWFRSPIAETDVDIVTVINEPDAVFKTEENTWTVEVAIPWQTLGATAPPLGAKLRGDVGLLIGDQNGVRTMQRQYWSGKTQTIVSDMAIEARLAPSLWGEIDCVEPTKNMHFGPDDVELNP